MSDLFTTDEKVSLLWKKLWNKPATSTTREFFQEPSIVSRPFVYQEDIVSNSIPSTAPSDIVGLTDNSLDDNGNVLKGSYAGKTSTLDPNIRYYHKIPLEFVLGTSGSCFQAKDATTSHPNGYADGSTPSNYGYSHNYGRVLQNSIPFNHAPDGSYNVTVYKDTLQSIPYGTSGGGWLVDSRPGTICFYQFGNITGVGEANPIFVSFFRYIGITGSTNASQVSTAITGSTNDFTVKQVFSGGDGSSGDQLSAIQVDARSLSSLTTGQLLDAIQFGDNTNGSWRICVQKTQSGSCFLVQARESGVWITKSSFTSP